MQRGAESGTENGAESGADAVAGWERRDFLKGAAGLILAFSLPAPLRALAADAASADAVLPDFAPNAFLRIGTDNLVTVISKHLEMGQGTYTGLATIVAEELDAEWAQVRVEAAPADARRYGNLAWGGVSQGTGGSTAMANSWQQLRETGATARALLVAAAAQSWRVAAADISVSNGVVTHAASGRRLTFGELAAAASRQPAPTAVVLKDPKDFKLIGRHLPRVDVPAKSDGSAIFTLDVRLPGMLTAMVAHPPKFGARVRSVDAVAARKIAGVVDVVTIPSGVAVLARDTWSAKKGRDALHVSWDDSAAFALGTADISARYRQLAKTPGMVASQQGNGGAVFSKSGNDARVFEASYDFPYLAHAAMEPMNCVIQLGPQRCEVWNGEQSHTSDQRALAGLLGLAPEQVVIHSLYAGGSFGRRASTQSDYVVEAATIARASGKMVPIKLVWLREDDMQAGFYRPQFHHRLRAAVDASGNLSVWQHTLVGQSIMAGLPSARGKPAGIDHSSVEGAVNLPYTTPHRLVELHTPTDIGVPVLWWRSVGSTHNAFSTETFIDEIAASQRRDPVEYRLAHLAQAPRHRAVLTLAAEKAGWKQTLPQRPGLRRGRGVAVHESFGSVVAQVVEVAVQPDGRYALERVVCAVDCGIAINPDNVRAQIEGSIAYALSAAKYGAITLDKGRVEQSNFHNYASIRIDEMPVVEVFILPSTNKPSGIGEPGVPPLAPALVNALASATGTRLYSLPIRSEALKA